MKNAEKPNLHVCLNVVAQMVDSCTKLVDMVNNSTKLYVI